MPSYTFAPLRLAALVFAFAAGSSYAAPEPPIAVCAGCHGAAGEGSITGAARLAGKNPDYLAHALSMFKAGTRAGDTMQAVARDLSDSDMRALADYFSKLQPPRPVGAPVPAPGLVAAGKQLAEAGAGPELAACFSCHATGGKGNGARFPAIAAESEAFLVNRLHAFQARAKAGPPAPGSMTAVASHMTESQVQQAAAYLSQLVP